MKNVYILLSILIVLASCRKDVDNVNSTSSTTGFEPVAVYINGTVAGKVVNESGDALAGVPVHLGNETTSSMDDGFFIFRNVPLNSRGAYIHIDHPGYWAASRRIVPQHNETHYTRLTLMQQHFAGQIVGSEGGEIELPEGTSVEFEPQSFVSLSGESYDGQVVVAARWMDPMQPESQAMMPGSFYGINTENKEVALKNYGITGVEFQTASGQPLQMAEGTTATLRFPIHTDLAVNAPQSISLWHFDEGSGMWREEGFANREGDEYVGRVSHFSFWSVNESFETVQIEGTLINDQGEPLANNPVSILFPAQNTFAAGFTNANGVFSGLVPANEALVLMVSDACNFSVYSQSIPPLSDDVNLGTIQVNSNEISTTTISGTLTNCSGESVSAAMIQICWPQGCQFIAPDLDGSFEQTFSWCGTDEFNIGIVDYSTGETFSTTQPAESNIELGTVEICDGPLETFISLDWNGTERFYPFPSQYVQSGRVFLRAESSDYTFRISIPEASVGQYMDADVSFNYNDYSTNPDIPLFLVSGSCFIGECDDLTINITQYGEVGEFIEGNYSGVVDFGTTIESFPNSPISGSFRIVRAM